MDQPKTMTLVSSAVAPALGVLPKAERATRSIDREAEALRTARECVESQLRRIPEKYFRADTHQYVFAPGLPFVVIHGPTDAGKTTAAVALLARESRRTLAWLTFLYYADFAMQASAFRFDGGELAAYIGAAASRDLLLLDDLGAELQTVQLSGDSREFGLTATYLLMEKRGTQGKKTILTTNVPRENWCRQFGQRIAARLERFGKIYELG